MFWIAHCYIDSYAGDCLNWVCDKLSFFCQAARALANLAAHGDSNNNNAAVGQEAGALEALVQLTKSPHEGVQQEAAGALWNLSFDDKNRESIAAFGGVEALVTCFLLFSFMCVHLTSSGNLSLCFLII